MLPRERLIEIVVAVSVVGTMVATLYAIGRRYGVEEDGHQVLTATGGEFLVYAIVAFILLLAAAGFLLLRAVTIVEAEDTVDDPTNDAADA